MSKFEGTPGPWIARIGFSIDVITDNDKAFGICDIGNLNQLHDADYDFEDAIANAKLIAAAPELLGALERLIIAAKPHCVETSQLNMRVKEAELIINKALGHE